MTAIIWL